METGAIKEIVTEIFTELWDISVRTVANQADYLTNRNWWKGKISNLKKQVGRLEDELNAAIESAEMDKYA